MSVDRPITAKPSPIHGRVCIAASLSSGGWGNSRIKVKATTDLSVEQAEDLLCELSAALEKVKAKLAAKAASDERRRKYQEREIAAGRMIVLSGGFR